MASTDPWIVHRTPRPRARVRLFCFPYAGGGASLFRTWSQSIASEIEVCPVQLPGREERIGEPLFERLAPLVAAVAGALRIHLNKPFAFFGHSMGAMISFELARHLRQQGAQAPVHLFASGSLPPHIPDRNPIHALPDEDVVKNMRELGGMPEETLQNKEMMDLLMPLIRADSAVTETYTHMPSAPLRCPIVAMGGLDDTMVTADDVASWQGHTSGPFTTQMFPGNHFFFLSAREQIVRFVQERLLASLPGSRSPLR